MAETIRSHGPDCLKGPGCCCDTCNEFRVGNCIEHCCTCIPNSLCGTFTPDYPDDTCPEPFSFDIDSASDTQYVVKLNGLDTLGFGLDDEFEKIYAKIDKIYDICSWLIEVPSQNLSRSYEIDYGVLPCDYGPDERTTCRSPSLTLTGVSYRGCIGTINIVKRVTEKVPFGNRTFDGSTEESLSTTCGACNSVCEILCAEVTADAVTTKIEFRWNPADQKWRDVNDNEMRVEENFYTGNCELIYPPFDPVEIDPAKCTFGMDLNLVDPNSSDTARVSCNPCKCWDWICGTCRCVCENMCISYWDGSTFHEETWTWDNLINGWVGNDDYNYVYIKRTADNQCEFASSIFTGTDSCDVCSVDIEACGQEGMGFFISKDLEGIVDDGLSPWIAGSCKACPTCFPPPGCDDCCDDCDAFEVLPETLFIDLVGRPVAESSSYELCIEEYGIPLYHYQPFREVPQRWIGAMVLPCKCTDPDTTAFEWNTFIVLECGTSGNWELRIRVERPNGGGSIEYIEQLGSEVTCNPWEWSGEVLDFGFSLGGNPVECCCLGAGIDFAISE